jgi:hypothetical protein
LILRHWLRNSEIRRFGSDDEDLQELYKNSDNNLREAFETVDEINFQVYISEREKAFNMNMDYKENSDYE